jgi:hypothetical protein
LGEAEGVDPEDLAAVRRMDRKRAKRTTNEESQSPIDPEAELARLKGGAHGAGVQSRERCGYEDRHHRDGDETESGRLEPLAS